MRFKAPGGDLNWLTPLIFIAGCFLGINAIIDDGLSVIAVVYLLLALGSVLVWLDQRWVAVPFMALLGLGVLGGLTLLVVNGFSWRMAFKTGFAALNIHSFWVWMRKEPDESELLEQLELEGDLGEYDVDDSSEREPEEWWQPSRPRRD